MNGKDKTALVLGAGGGIGGEVARQLRDAGWQVKALKRGQAATHELRDGIHWLRGDALNASEVARAAQGCAVIVHAVNPPGYRDWEKLVLPMLDNTIAAARAVGARIVLPGTIYNFGVDAFPVLSEYSLQQPHTRKGQIRVEMEKRLREATALGARTLIVRAGDFFGPRAGNNWFSQGLLAGSSEVRRVLYPGPRELGHSWAYLPDVAETVARLLEADERLEPFAVFHFRGHWLERGVDMAETICRLTGLSPKRIFAFPWWAVRIASPFVEVCREMLEMRYLWEVPAQLDNTRLRSVIGQEPHTPLEEAVKQTLADRVVTRA